MDESLRIIQHLYGESTDDSAVSRQLAEDEELQREYEQLQSTKEVLDRRSPQRPDSAVVDRVVDTARHAAGTTASSDLAGDRSPRAPSRSWTRQLQGVSAALAVVLLVGLVWWQLPGAPEASGPEAADERAASSGSPAAATEAQAGATAERMPSWDDSDELVRISRRIDRLEAQSTPEAWGRDIQTVSRP